MLQINGRTFLKKEKDLTMVVRDPSQGSPFYLNDSGRMLWEELVKGTTREALSMLLCREYEVSREQADQDVEEFLRYLRALGLLGDVQEGVVAAPPLYLHTGEFRAYCGEQELPLSRKEYELLLLLVKNRGALLTYEQIGQALYGMFLPGDQKGLMMLVSRLRKRLECHGELKDCVETVRGQGYLYRG